MDQLIAVGKRGLRKTNMHVFLWNYSVPLCVARTASTDPASLQTAFVFILKKQLLIDQAGDVGQQVNPAILCHAEGR